MQAHVLRTFFVSACLAAAFLTCPGPVRAADPAPGAAATARVADLAWLAGLWEGEKDGARNEEQWLAPAGGTMLGVSRTLAGGKTVFLEFMRIDEAAGKVVMTVYPAAGAGVPFTLARSGPAEAVFENPAHDFPQRILYRRETGERLFARIESVAPGGPAGSDYHFRLIGTGPAEAKPPKAVRKEALVAAGLADAWAAWTTPEGLRSFFAPQVNMRLEVGGPFEILFNPDSPEGSRGSEGCTVLAFAPPRVLAFSWNAPPSMPTVRRERTQVVVELEPLGERLTRVRLTHTGWKEGAEWDQAYAYFDIAWGKVLSSLVQSFAAK
jgi:uncharacterized protein YndB with AHSA1/START domain